MRVAPFACIAALAEISLAFSSKPASPWAIGVSIALLLAVAASFALPWERLPGWLPVLVPLAYTGSVLALTLAAGETSGVGIVALVPLVWTALFQRCWESACVLAAVVSVELIGSLTPVTDPAPVIARRVILWAGLGMVCAYATHELRERDHRSRREAARLQAQVTELTVARDRDRIAADLQDKVIRQVFAAGLSLQSTATLSTEPEVRRRILASAENLDEVLRLTREAVFGLEQRLRSRGLRAEVLALCSGISPVPEVSFTGPADDALDPARAAQLVQALRGALSVIRDHSKPERVVIATGGTTCTAEIETDGPFPDSSSAPAWHALLKDSVSQTNIRFQAEPLGDGTRFTWSIPCLSTSRAGQSSVPETARRAASRFCIFCAIGVPWLSHPLGHGTLPSRGG
jgi:signal transduction histidine kinase